MKNEIAARKLITALLNTYCLDPYPSTLTRPGQHFYDESDGINLTRGNTFPKGFVTLGEEPTKNTKTFSKAGFMQFERTIDIHYIVKNKTSYTDVTPITYKERDYAIYMKHQIESTLLNHKILPDNYVINEVKNVDPADPIETDRGFILYEIVVPVIVKWVVKHGA